MAGPVSQRAHRDSLLEANRAVIGRIRDAVSTVAPDALTRRPAAGGWSIAEVLEHLIVSADSYLKSLRIIVQRKDAARAQSDSMWKPSLMGGLLAQSLRNPRKLPAPKSYKPGPSPRPRVLDEFLQRQEELGRILTEAAPMYWRRVRMRSPIAPILRMNLGDALTVLVVHAERHAGQIERVKATTLGETRP
jgi:DinB superfamily